MKQFASDASTQVRTKQGILQGYQFDGTYIFKGVHYAESGRFQPPVPVEPWEGVKDATSYGFVCPLMHPERPMGELLVPHAYWPQDEHCQNLNIWTQSICPEAKKPVFVWFHGGGLSAGSAIEQVSYDGNALSKFGDVVVVTVNHRLNIIGYLDLEPFGEKYKNSANAGNADLVAALQWVHENIAAFGGDPENVTIFGQSGGGMKVTGLMQTPAADGLYHKAIAMSGVLPAEMMKPAEGDGTEIVTGMLSWLGLSVADVEQLETLPYEKLVEAYEAVAPALQAKGHYVGQDLMINDFYHGEEIPCGINAYAKKVPLLVGSCIAEFGFMPRDFDPATLTEEEMRARLTAVYGADADELVKLFREAYPEKCPMDLLVLDHMTRRASRDLVRHHAEVADAPAYSYLFTFEFPIQGGKPAWHCSDIAFAFHNIDLVPVANVPGTTDKLQEQIAGAFVNFAKYGDPSGPCAKGLDIPFWPSSTPTETPTMIFDRTCRVAVNFDDALIALHQKAAPPFRFGAVENAQH